jgi:hypothetical protein
LPKLKKLTNLNSRKTSLGGDREMKTQLKKLRIPALLTIVIIAALLGAYALGSSQKTYVSVQGITHSDTVTTVMRHADGTVFFNETQHNVLTTIGATAIRDALSTGTMPSSGIAKYISLSTDATPLISWTKLANELTATGLARQAGTVSNINATCYQVQTTFTAQSPQAGIIAEALHWVATSNTDNNMLAAAAISSASVISGDTIQCTWQINIPAA